LYHHKSLRNVVIYGQRPRHHSSDKKKTKMRVGMITHNRFLYPPNIAPLVHVSRYAVIHQDGYHTVVTIIFNNIWTARIV